MRYRVRLTPAARADFRGIHAYIRDRSSSARAEGYCARLGAFLDRLDTFPNRGTPRPDIGPGLRIVGFERRVTVAFAVAGDEVIVVRLLYGGRQFESDMGDFQPD